MVRNNGRTPAYNCKIKMKFFEASSKKPLFEVNGKWDRGPQPLLYAPVPLRVLSDGRIETKVHEFPHDFLIPFSEVLDVYPSIPEPEGFCIAVKYNNEQECYAFSSWSYLKGVGHRVNEWKLNSGEYAVEIELTYSGKRFAENFCLINTGTQMDSIEIKKPGSK